MKHFKPYYAITTHKVQGMTIDRPFTIYQKEVMNSSMLYVSLTRTTQMSLVNFADYDGKPQYEGVLYKYTLIGTERHYIGSTTNIKKRDEEHRQRKKTEFDRALDEYGYDNFKFEILEKLEFNCRKNLFDKEDYYINLYDSINSGFNSRKNQKNFTNNNIDGA